MITIDIADYSVRTITYEGDSTSIQITKCFVTGNVHMNNKTTSFDISITPDEHAMLLSIIERMKEPSVATIRLPKLCRECGATMPEGAIFCIECSAPVYSS